MTDLTRPWPQRRSIRLPNYDYSSAGAYFITICTQDRRCLLGNVSQGEMIASAAGAVVERSWQELPSRFTGIELDWFQIMPNHVHGIVMLRPQDNDSAETPTLGDVIRVFKSVTTTEYSRGVREHGWPRFRTRFWHWNYYEHIIRNERELAEVRRYIEQNPLQWSIDRENPAVIEPADELPWEKSTS